MEFSKNYNFYDLIPGKLGTIHVSDIGKSEGTWVALREGETTGIPRRFEYNDQTQEWKFYFEPYSFKGKLDNNSAIGKWQWCLDKKILAEGYFDKGNKEGQWKSYFLNGKPWATQCFLNDKKTGEWSLKRETGEVVSKGSYDNDKKQGKWVSYHYYNDGTNDDWITVDNRRIGSYNQGNKVGIWEIRSNYEGHTLNDRLLKTKEYDGQGRKIGKWKTYNLNGDLLRLENHENNNEEHEETTYYTSGEIRSSLLYKNDKKEGPYKFYTESGEEFVLENFKNDKRNGESKSYSLDFRQLLTHEYYKNGKRHGVSKWYYENGQLKRVKHYENGKGISVSKWYYENGQLRKLKNYQTKEEIEYLENGELKT